MRIENQNLTLADYQEAILYDPARFTITEASTKTGKTFSHLYWLYELSHGKNPQWWSDQVEPGWNFWWVAPVFSQAEIAFKRLKRKLAHTGAYKVNESKLFIETPLETIIGFKSADKPDSLYGEDVYGAVFDEFTRAKESAWHALRSTLTATKAPCKFIGNYTGSTNWGHKLSKKAKSNKQYSYHRVTAYDAVEAGILEEEEIDQARSDLPLSIFEALYLAKGSLDDDILFSENVLDSFFENDYIQRGNRRYITADIALHGSDRFVIVVWYGFVIVDIVVIDKCNSKEVEDNIRLVAHAHGVPNHRIIYDADGVGSFLEGYLSGAVPFKNGSSPIKIKGAKVNYENLKTQCYYSLSKRLANGGAFCQDLRYKEDIQRELEQVKKHNTDKGGKIRILPKEMMKQILGYSPDFADAIMMREYFELIKNAYDSYTGEAESTY